jgi:hypothetical protein
MRKRVTRHIKGNLWIWTGGFAVAGAAFIALGWGTPAAFCFMLTGILTIFADAHIDPVALITEDALHPEGPAIDQPPGTGTGSPVT